MNRLEVCRQQHGVGHARNAVEDGKEATNGDCALFENAEWDDGSGKTIISL